MTVDERYKLSSYKEISVLSENSSKKICVVMEEVTNKLYVKKVLPDTEYFNFYVRFASLQHKNLIEIHDVICCGDATHVFEEYINGQTLQALLENEGAQQESKVVDYILQVCDALIFLHSQDPPIIHRDIKPENIMLSADNVIKLVDFDIAREFKQSANRDTTFMGTKEYAAPEQYGYKQTDGRTDIYAIGVLLHEMLTGKLPENSITYKGALRKIILKCLRMEPEQRYQNVSALKKALANTRVGRYRRLGIRTLTIISATIAMYVLIPKNPGYLYNSSNAPSASTQPETEQSPDEPDNPATDTPPSAQPEAEQNSDDLNSPEPDAPPSAQPEAEQNPDDLNNQYTNDPLAARTIMGQKFYDIAGLFMKVYDFEENPTIILEHEAINKIIRSITGDYYDSVARAFKDYDDSYWKAFYDSDKNECVIVTCDFVERAEPYDRLLFEVGGEHMNITYYDSAQETTFCFTTNNDKGRLSENAFNWMQNYLYMRESLVVFDEAPVTDVTGVYYFGNQKKIEIFEEAGEMKFSYTDIKMSKDAEPLLVETIHKLDDNHYWIKTFYDCGKEMLVFNFSQNHLTLLHRLLDDARDMVYDIGGRGVSSSIDPRGIYYKS